METIENVKTVDETHPVAIVEKYMAFINTPAVNMVEVVFGKALFPHICTLYCFIPGTIVPSLAWYIKSGLYLVLSLA